MGIGRGRQAASVLQVLTPPQHSHIHTHKPSHSSLPDSTYGFIIYESIWSFPEPVYLFSLYYLSWVFSASVSPSVLILWKQDCAVERALDLESGPVTYSFSSSPGYWPLTSELPFLPLDSGNKIPSLPWFTGFLEDHMCTFILIIQKYVADFSIFIISALLTATLVQALIITLLTWLLQ